MLCSMKENCLFLSFISLLFASCLTHLISHKSFGLFTVLLKENCLNKGTLVLLDTHTCASKASDSDASKKRPAGKKKKKKTTMSFVEDQTKRKVTFSKRKSGIMKKASDLATLTGADVLLVVVNENGINPFLSIFRRPYAFPSE